MNNIYVTEPPPNGKVLLETSKGDIEIELWPKEAPKAVRNFLTLAMEGYYDGQIWHRIVPGFCIQTGDPTGTGAGGESCYGEPFANEPHQRLRFNRRGLVAMANSGEPDSNESQFFIRHKITLDQTPELQGKHTIFGRVSGPTIYNVTSLSEVELSKKEPDRPVYPPKLLSVQILDNPFDDIVPRITKEEKRAQLKARREAAESNQRERERKKAKKNVGLLSFREAEEVELEKNGEKTRKGISSHDLLKDDKRLKTESMVIETNDWNKKSKVEASSPPNGSQARDDSREESKGKKKRKENDDESSQDLSSIRSNHSKSKQSGSTASKIQSLEDSIRGISASSHLKAESEEEEKNKEKKAHRGRELLEQARLQYLESSSRKGGKKRSSESEALKALEKFQTSLRAGNSKGKEKGKDPKKSSSDDKQVKERNWAEVEDEEIPPEDREYGAGDDEDEDWRSHRLDSGGVPISSKQDKFQLSDYEVLDPRNASSTEAASLGFGSSKDQKSAAEEARRKGGRRGRDWVDSSDRKYEKGNGNGKSRGGYESFHSEDRKKRRGEDDKPEWGKKK